MKLVTVKIYSAAVAARPAGRSRWVGRGARGGGEDRARCVTCAADPRRRRGTGAHVVIYYVSPVVEHLLAVPTVSRPRIIILLLLLQQLCSSRLSRRRVPSAAAATTITTITTTRGVARASRK